MSELNDQAALEAEAPEHHVNPRCTLHVCTSCRAAGAPREPQESRAGFILYEQLRKAFNNNPLKARVDVIPTPCLSICPRPCGIALSLPDSWTYLFGDQQPNETIDDVVECVSLYLESPEGCMQRAQRPQSLRRSILGRVPPIQKADHASS